MEFVIAKKDFNSAVRQILVGRDATSMDPVDVTVDQSDLLSLKQWAPMFRFP